MEKICNLFSLLQDSCEINEEMDIVSIKTVYDEYTSKIFNYTQLKELKELYKSFLDIFVSSKVNNEINIFNFLDNEEELQEEINDMNLNETLVTITFNKIKYIRSTLNIPDNINLIFVVQEKFLVELLKNSVQSLENIMFSFSKKTVIVLADSDIDESNEFYNIIGFNKLRNKIYSIESSYVRNTKRVIDIRNEYCNWITSTEYITPDELYINFASGEIITPIEQRICKITVDSCIAFLANFTGTIHDEFVSIINGTKKIKIEYDLLIEDYTRESYENIYNIYKWVYHEYSPNKIYICRNVISILISAKCQGSVYKTILNNSDWILESIKSNYETFLTENVNDFFKQKTALAEQIREKVENIHFQINDITKVLVNNFTSLIGISITAVLGYISKGNLGLVKILALLYLIYIDFSASFSLPLVFIRYSQVKNDFNKKENDYVKTYIEDEFTRNIEKRFSSNKKIFWWYFVLIIISIIILNIAIITFIARPDIYRNVLEKLYITK
ncbi:hypothetical protein [Clostridium sp.]|uniref:hypothetical protein n=1 Tax=Clostridium sp. TaxID=1506 RepID=UPI0032173BAD